MCNKFIFNFGKIINTVNSLNCTKRNVLKITDMFYDPIGMLCPIVLQLKLFTKICNKKSGCDSLLNADIQLLWSLFLNNLAQVNTIHINRHIFSPQTNYKDIVLHGFCDTSNKAYAAVVYLHIVNNNGTFINLLTAKSNVVPNKRQCTIGPTATTVQSSKQLNF